MGISFWGGKLIKIVPLGETWLLAAVKTCTTENCHKAEEQTGEKSFRVFGESRNGKRLKSIKSERILSIKICETLKEWGQPQWPPVDDSPTTFGFACIWFSCCSYNIHQLAFNTLGRSVLFKKSQLIPFVICICLFHLPFVNCSPLPSFALSQLVPFAKLPKEVDFFSSPDQHAAPLVHPLSNALQQCCLRGNSMISSWFQIPNPIIKRQKSQVHF